MIDGECDARFAAVRDTFAASVEAGREVGASFAATLDGRMVVDLWGGHADAARTRPWERDTIVNVFSTTKAAALYDWDRYAAAIAAERPWWEPGTANGYHALTFGHLVGEVIRRISGKRIGQFLRDEVTGPLGADFHIGLPASEERRCGEMV